MLGQGLELEIERARAEASASGAAPASSGVLLESLEDFLLDAVGNFGSFLRVGFLDGAVGVLGGGRGCGRGEQGENREQLKCHFHNDGEFGF